MREYNEDTYRYPRTMDEAFGPYAVLDDENRATPLDAIWYVIKSILSGIGVITLIAMAGYFWSIK